MANTIAKKERIKYIDALKVLAIFAVIMLHVSRIGINAEVLHININRLMEIIRFGVPIFLMVSGSLLLNKEIELDSFLKKRFIRIVLPLVFYTAISFIFMLNIFETPLVAYWYCWMIICAYLAIPIINIFIQHAKMKEIEYFLIVFIIATTIYQLALYFGIKHCLDLNFFIGPVSYMILGYYLSKKEFKKSPNQIILTSILVFIISTIIKIGINMNFSFDSGNLVSYLGFSFLRIIQAGAVFLIFRYLYETKSGIFSKIRGVLEIKPVNKFILSVSRASYGMFFFHILINESIVTYMKSLPLTGTQTCLSIIGITIGLFIISWLGVLILGQIPYIKKVSGYY